MSGVVERANFLGIGWEGRKGNSVNGVRGIVGRAVEATPRAFFQNINIILI
jgi:hypothetical protein